MFFYTGSSLKPFLEPSSANTRNVSAGESSRARDAYKQGLVQDGTTSRDPKTVVDSKEPALPLRKKEGVSKKMLADQVGDDKNQRGTSLPEHNKEAPTQSDSTIPPAAGAADESDHSDHSAE